MQGSWSVFAKNARNFIPGLVAFTNESRQAFSTWRKIYNRGYAYGPTEFKEQAEEYTPDYWKRGHSQDKNMWVDKKLSEEVSQKEVAQLMRYKHSMWSMAHVSAIGLVFGGYALPFAFVWMANDTWMPASFSRTPEEKKQWYAAQDMYRYRSIPTYITDTRWFFNLSCFPYNQVHERAWDDLFEKNDVRRPPKDIRPAAEMYDGFLKFHQIRRRSLRYLCRSMNAPTFPMLTRTCGSARVKDYWNLAWNEDYMVITQKLHESMSDEELYDYAWRRFLAPYDKNLTRDGLMTRVNDYFEFLGPKFVEEGKAPNLIILTNYVMGYYNDPAYLVEDLSALEGNDFEYLAHYGRDAYLRRLEFENGPLRDQVEAHSQKVLAERAAAAKAAEEPKKVEA